ncbi:MAG: low molecular weight phosphotyrosine protein phosphatase [Succinivibrio sp.]|nr:low molecular weight phosphotyrosine protein phosphatase [Succinivibrio sp.]
MFNILFCCHGNICRSPMAEFALREMVKNFGIDSQFCIASAATSQEELGNGVYPPVKKLLSSLGIDSSGKHARQIKRTDFSEYDLIILMEEYNRTNLLKLYPDAPSDKISLLLDYTDRKGDIDDPWYTGEFKRSFDEIVYGLCGLLLCLNKDRGLKLSANLLEKLQTPEKIFSD